MKNLFYDVNVIRQVIKEIASSKDPIILLEHKRQINKIPRIGNMIIQWYDKFTGINEKQDIQIRDSLVYFLDNLNELNEEGFDILSRHMADLGYIIIDYWDSISYVTKFMNDPSALDKHLKRFQMQKLDEKEFEKERQKKERLEKERLQQEQIDKEILQARKLEQERLEQERLEQERLEIENQKTLDELQKFKEQKSPKKPKRKSQKEIPKPDKPEIVDRYAQPSAHTAPDTFALKDSLGYEVYTHAISSFLMHEKTDPPLAISIQAPWGGGKTSLMRMIQNELDPAGASAFDRSSVLTKTKKATVSEIKKFLGFKEYNFQLPDKDFKRITIWFNPWKYEDTEQIWAGLAHAIITQFSERLGENDREKFLLSLHLKRTGKTIPQKKIHEYILKQWWEKTRKHLWIYASGIAASSFTTLIATLGSVTEVIPFGIGGLLTTVASGIGLGIIQYKKTENNVETESANSVLGEQLQIPDYKSRLGLVHYVHEDLTRVFEILNQNGITKPIVIFIDDLDRCSPTKVAEVVEAINRFISSEFPNCIFVIGMDTQQVAASLEKHYEGIIEKLPNFSKQVSMGWRFMDKFIQLPVILPPPDLETTKLYAHSILSSRDEKIESEAKKEVEKIPTQEIEQIKNNEEVENKAKELAGSNSEEGFLETVKAKLSEKLQETKNEKAKKTIDRASENWSDQSKEVQEHVANVIADFSDNPREIKRFLNVLRFNEVLQEGRKDLGYVKPPANVLRKWIVLSMKWPQLTLWLHRGSGGIGYDRNIFENLTSDLLDQLETASSQDMDEWEKTLKTLFNIKEEDEAFVPWIKDESLKNFFMHDNETPPKLSDANGMGLY